MITKNSRYLFSLFIAGLASPLIAFSELPESLSFQQGLNDYTGTPYTGATSTMLRNGAPEANWGMANNLVFGRDYKSLLRFDLSALEGVVEGIETVTLTLKHRPISGAFLEIPVTVHVVSAANATWIPGTGNNTAAAPGEPAPAFLARGESGDPDIPWAGGVNFGYSPGEDYDLDPVASFTWQRLNELRETEITLPADLVMSWIRNPEANAGLVFRSQVAQPSGWTGDTGDFYSVAYGGGDSELWELRPKLTIVPGDPTFSYNDWVAAEGIEAGQQGPLDEPAGDGVANIIKFVLGLSPYASAAGSLPATEMVTEGGVDFLALRFPHPVGRAGVELRLEASDDLISWEEVASEVAVAEDVNGERNVRLVDAVTVTDRERRFLRLRIDYEEPVPENLQTAVFRQGADDFTGSPYTGAGSVFMRDAQPETNWGGGPTLVIGRDYGSLLRFDLASLQSEVESVYAVELRLFVAAATNLDLDPFDFSIYKVAAANAGWIPGTGINAPAATGEPAAAFLARGEPGNSDTSWAGGGLFGDPEVDYEDLMGGGTWTAQPQVEEIVITLSRDVVQDWIDNPGDNAGLYIRSTASWVGHTGAFYSVNYSAAFRPELRIQYIPVD